MNALEHAHAELDAAETPSILPEATRLELRPTVPPPPADLVPFEEIGGVQYLRDVKGRLVPKDAIQPVDLLIDEQVRVIAYYARHLSKQVARYKAHTIDDIAGLRALVGQEHGVDLGGKKGNLTLTSHDGLKKVSVKIADITYFGIELQAAKAKFDECIRAWAEGANPKLRALVDLAFQADQEGRINRGNLLYLQRLAVDDPTWKEAVELIRAAERPAGTKEYITVHEREDVGAPWKLVAIDVAAA